MSIINAQMLAKVIYPSLIMVGYNKGVGPLTKMMDDAAGKYLPESWIKWIPTSYIAKAVFAGVGGFGMHKLQTWTQPIKEVNVPVKPATFLEHCQAVADGVKTKLTADNSGLATLKQEVVTVFSDVTIIGADAETTVHLVMSKPAAAL